MFSIIRLFFKNQLDVCIKNPLFYLLYELDDKFIQTKRYINNFYLLLKKKYINFIEIVKFRRISKRNYRSNDIKIQIIKLFYIKDIFNSIFFNTNNNDYKLYKYILTLTNNKNNIEVDIHLKELLRNCIKLFGINFFREYEIILIDTYQYEDLNNDQLNKYIFYFYYKVKKKLDDIIKSYYLFKIYDIKLKKLCYW